MLIPSTIPNIVPIGCILPYGGPLAQGEAQAGVLDEIKYYLARTGWMFCDGTPLNCKDYAQLYSVIGKSFGFDEGAGTFNLPNLQGMFIRGVDGNASVDPDVSSRKPAVKNANPNAVGSTQQDAFQGHEHYYKGVLTPAADLTLGPGDAPTSGVMPDQVTTSEIEQSPDGKPRVASETRPVNIYLNYIIRYL
jgi:microcystin-dependent protein